MKFENTDVWGFEHALRGMRNPKNSWRKSDSDCSDNCHASNPEIDCKDCKFYFGNNRPCKPDIGENDMRLAQSLIRGGSEHRKFLRQIIVSVDITAPLYWWKEFDTYKVGTVSNSTSTMHKIASAPITLECFEVDDFNSRLQLIDPTHLGVRVDSFIDDLEQLRQLHLLHLEKSKKEYLSEDKRKQHAETAKYYWKELIRWLPESWLQTRTITMSYENLLAMYRQRGNHKLSEWRDSFCGWVQTLPYSAELIQCK